MEGLLIVLASIMATLLGGALALVRYDHIVIVREQDVLRARVEKLERATVLPGAHSCAHLSTSAPTEEST